MRLDDLARLLDGRLIGAQTGRGAAVAGSGDDRVDDVEHDSRRVKPGTLFACIPGSSFDGHQFADEALASGASALLAEREIPASVPVIVVESVRQSVGLAAAAVHGNPSEHLDLAGVTGTNGKTTTVSVLSGLLRTAGRDTAGIGTLTGALTTPEATDLQRTLADAVRQGLSAVAMEVSSHGLAQRRLNGCRFRVAAFTNLGHDHLDYHGSLEEYFAAKAELFSADLTERAVIVVASKWGRRLAELAARQMPVIEVDPTTTELIEADSRSSVFRWRDQEVTLPLGGSFNRANAVLAAEMAVALGLSPASAAEGLAAATQVPGRFEAVRAGQDFAVIVDYAHTADGLEAVLHAARALTERRLTVVFGAGGDRDRSKRPRMGAVAERLADRVILTSDNPRSEDPTRIIEEIASGMTQPPERREPDRRHALRHALATSWRGDTVVIAGKGHETSQTIGTSTLVFDDRDVVAEELRRLATRRQRHGGER